MISFRQLYYSIYRRLTYIKRKLTLAEFGHKSLIFKPLHIMGGGKIHIGNNVIVGYKGWLAAMPHTGEQDCSLTIGDRCHIGSFNEIYAVGKIIIESDVLTADRVYISDNLHGYEDIDTPVFKQPIKHTGGVRIGEGSWLGVGVSVIGANIGKHCVIGANAVVNRDIPDYCVAVGVPAKIVKRYNPKTRKWEKTAPDGSFLTNH